MDVNKILSNKIDNLPQPEFTSKSRPEKFNRNEKIATKDVELTKESANDLVDVLNSAAKSVNQRVSFQFHEKANRVVMKVVDTGTSEVIREIPPKEMIRLLEHMHDLIGMFVDESR